MQEFSANSCSTSVFEEELKEEDGTRLSQGVPVYGYVLDAALNMCELELQVEIFKISASYQSYHEN